MLKDNNTFVTLTEMVNHLSHLPGVVGVVEYGSRTHSNMLPGGDYDLTVIFEQLISKNVSGIHLHVGGIPVDCMLLSIADFTLPTPSDSFHLVHLNCTILYDKNGITKALLEDVKTHWCKPNALNDSQKMWIRFGAKHTLDKLKHRLLDDEIYSHFFIAQTCGYLMEIYTDLNGLELGKIQVQLAHMQANDPVLYEYICTLLKTLDMSIKFDMLQKSMDYLAADLGGMWVEGEALFHLNPDGVNDVPEQRALIKFLLGGTCENT